MKRQRTPKEPQWDEREAFLKRVAAGPHGALRLRQLIEQALNHLWATGDIKRMREATDAAIWQERNPNV